MTIQLSVYTPSEQAVIRRSAAKVRRPGESIGASLRRFAENPKYGVLRHQGKVVGIQRFPLDYLTYDLTPIGGGQFGWNEARQRREFLDKALASLS